MQSARRSASWRGRQVLRTYRPRISIHDGGHEQSFDANVLAIEDIDGVDGASLIAFGELIPQAGRPLDQGTPLHSLILQISGEEMTVELNDQGNQREVNDVERCELSPSFFRVRFTRGHGPHSGRVSLSPEIELFDVPDEESVLLRSVRVGLANVAAQLELLRKELHQHSVIAKKLVELEG